VGLAGADGASEQNIFAARNPLASGQLSDLRGREAIGDGEIEFVERLHFGERGRVQSLLDGGLGTRRDLDGENLVQVVLVRPVLLARLSGEVAE
jgi:hypothetical protein